MMKRFLLVLLVLAAFTAVLSADGPMTGIFAAADQVATEIPRILPDDGYLILGGIARDGLMLKLGDLFADLSANRLTGRSDFGVSVSRQYTGSGAPASSADWMLSGSLYDAGAGYLLILQLNDSEGLQLKGWEFALSSGDVENLLVPSLMSGSGAWDSFEPNDNSAGAALIELPFSADSLSLGGGDEDWFAFDVPAGRGEAVLIMDAATRGAMDTYLELYSPDDQSWPVAEDDDTDGGNAVIQMPLTSPGRWYLKVRAYSTEEDGEYGLSINLNEGTLGPGEPDEGAEAAGRLNVGAVPLEKRIDYINDEDWFRINLLRPLGMNEVLRVETVSGMDLVLELLDEYESTILEDDDSGEGNNPMMMASGLDSGTYYAVVSSLGGEIGPYEIMANIMIPVRDEYEDDGTIESASLISVDDEPQKRSFSPMGDTDWVKFEVLLNDIYVMETRGEIDTYMELYDSDGDMLEENDDGDDYNARIERRLRPGIYYLKVSPYGSASPDDIYELNVESD